MSLTGESRRSQRALWAAAGGSASEVHRSSAAKVYRSCTASA